MIFLVPISPEVPPKHKPMLWQGLVLILTLGLCYLHTQRYFEKDLKFITHLEALPLEKGDTGRVDYVALDKYLKKRPLLQIAPARGDWNIKRLVYANFLHEGPAHLLLNLVGVFAGMRLCSTFIPFACSLSIFLLGGSLGLFASLFLTTEPTAYIPHLGSSAGLFALMGTYYIYNFRYRTRYFFWFPSKRGFISLRTSWFFFLDALMMEIVLSLAQLFPSHLDSVDHLAHVVGFSSGMLLALGLRFFQRWPGFVQTRPEFRYWATRTSPRESLSAGEKLVRWVSLLEINPYNDQVKLRLFLLTRKNLAELSDEQLGLIFAFISPTFIRLHPEPVSYLVARSLALGRGLPLAWLKATPYDSIILLSKFLAGRAEDQPLLLSFVTLYRRAHPEGGDIERKLELLTRKLNGLVQSSGGAAKTVSEVPSELPGDGKKNSQQA